MTELERRILDLEGAGWRSQVARENAARELGLTITKYMQLLNALLEREEALAYAPVTVNRLRRQRQKSEVRLH